MDENEKVRVFISSSCGPCHEIKELIEQGRTNHKEIELIDLETEEGAPYAEQLGLKRVPAAYIGTESCEIGINREENKLIIQCPGTEESPQLPQRVAEPS